MRVTRITGENSSFFAPLMPEFSAGTQALGCIDENWRAIGAALFSSERDTVSLDWIYMDPESRRKGGARILLRTAERLLKGKFSGLTASFTGEEEGLEAFFRKAGFFVTEGDPVINLNLGEAKEKAWYRKAAAFSEGDIRQLSELPRKDRSRAYDYIRAHAGSGFSLEHEGMGKSLFRFDSKGEISACLLVTEAAEQQVNADLLVNTGAVTGLLALFKKVVDAFPEGTNLSFVAANPEVERLIEGFLEPEDTFLRKSVIRYAVRPL